MKSLDMVVGYRLNKVVSVATAGALAVGLTFGIASSALAAEDGITVSGSIAPSLTLVVPTESFDFGALTPDGTGTEGASVTPAIDEDGATYTYGGAGAIEVQSNAAWTGTVAATVTTETTLTAADLSLNNGTATTALAAPVAFGSGLTGAPTTYDHDYVMRVDWTDTTGAFGATITYEVTNAAPVDPEV